MGVEHDQTIALALTLVLLLLVMLRPVYIVASFFSSPCLVCTYRRASCTVYRSSSVLSSCGCSMACQQLSLANRQCPVLLADSLPSGLLRLLLALQNVATQHGGVVSRVTWDPVNACATTDFLIPSLGGGRAHCYGFDALPPHSFQVLWSVWLANEGPLVSCIWHHVCVDTSNVSVGRATRRMVSSLVAMCWYYVWHPHSCYLKMLRRLLLGNPNGARRLALSRPFRAYLIVAVDGRVQIQDILHYQLNPPFPVPGTTNRYHVRLTTANLFCLTLLGAVVKFHFSDLILTTVHQLSSNPPEVLEQHLRTRLWLGCYSGTPLAVIRSDIAAALGTPSLDFISPELLRVREVFQFVPSLMMESARVARCQLLHQNLPLEILHHVLHHYYYYTAHRTLPAALYMSPPLALCECELWQQLEVQVCREMFELMGENAVVAPLALQH
eukprot:scpid60495/ scgid5639/ 